jgi:hypothetical protein
MGADTPHARPGCSPHDESTDFWNSLRALGMDPGDLTAVLGLQGFLLESAL